VTAMARPAIVFSLILAGSLFLLGFGGQDIEGPATVLMPEQGSPYVAFRIWFDVGSQSDPEGKEGLAVLTAGMLAEGSTTENPYDRILELLYPMAAGYGVSVDKEMTVFSGTVHRDNLEEYYELLRQAILSPAFAEQDFNRLHAQHSNYVERVRRFSSDEELGKELLSREVFRGTAFEAPEEGYVGSVAELTLDDVRSFYSTHYRRGNVVVGLGGGYPEGFAERVAADFEALPEGEPEPVPAPEPRPIEGMQVLIVEKDTDVTAISFGYPISLLRSDADFYAMMLANSWLGEHRNSSSRLYQVIREIRGMNYGDYSYIEAFPTGHRTTMPPVNVSRRQQMFQVWIRPVRNEHRLFAFRAALRELQLLIENGLTEEQLELTRSFLHNYTVNYGSTVSHRLGYRLDDLFYGLEGSHLERIRPELAALTLDDVNDAIRRHLQCRDMWVVFITRDAESLRDALVGNEPSPITYESEKPAEVLAEDLEIEAYPINVSPENVTIISIMEVLEN